MEIIVFILGVFVLGVSINKFTTDKYLRLMMWSVCAVMLIWFSLWLLRVKFFMLPIVGWRI